MREVTIYGITANRAQAGSYVEMYRMAPPDCLRALGADDMLVLPKEMAQRIQLKVHTIRKAQKVRGVRSADPMDSYTQVSETYIAIEPELEQLLMLPLQARLDAAISEAGKHSKDAELLRQRLAAFNARPWYQRVWLSLRGQP